MNSHQGPQPSHLTAPWGYPGTLPHGNMTSRDIPHPWTVNSCHPVDIFFLDSVITLALSPGRK